MGYIQKLQCPYHKVRNELWGASCATSTVTSKGQITIAAPVRLALGLEAGSRVEFVEVEKGRYLMVAATDDVQSLKGMLRKPNSAVSVEQMNEAIAERGAGWQ